MISTYVTITFSLIRLKTHPSDEFGITIENERCIIDEYG
jgi:hypothetical protein